MFPEFLEFDPSLRGEFGSRRGPMTTTMCIVFFVKLAEKVGPVGTQQWSHRISARDPQLAVGGCTVTPSRCMGDLLSCIAVNEPLLLVISRSLIQ